MWKIDPLYSQIPQTSCYSQLDSTNDRFYHSWNWQISFTLWIDGPYVIYFPLSQVVGFVLNPFKAYPTEMLALIEEKLA